MSNFDDVLKNILGFSEEQIAFFDCYRAVCFKADNRHYAGFEMKLPTGEIVPIDYDIANFSTEFDAKQAFKFAGALTKYTLENLIMLYALNQKGLEKTILTADSTGKTIRIEVPTNKKSAITTE